MTPKEKAKELINRYINLYSHQTEDYLDNEEAEQCALIAVDEILNSGKDVDEFCDSYWQEVKQEINLL